MVLSPVIAKPGEMIVIIGPMTCGKSILLEKFLNEGRIRSSQVLKWTHRSDLLPQYEKHGVVYHFNSLIALSTARWAQLEGHSSNLARVLNRCPIGGLSYWTDVLRWPGYKRAIVPVIDELSWWRRITDRLVFVSESGEQTRYPADFWLQLAQLTDLETHYRLLFSRLRNDGIEFVAVDATNINYAVIDNLELHLSKIGLQRAALTDHDIRVFTRHAGFQEGPTEWHRAQNAIKHGRSNAMRSLLEDTERIICADLRGKSILDTKCGWGAFCFEAERRQAVRVVGLETDVDRFAAACGMKRMLESSAQFLLTDINSSLDDAFDLVVRTDGRLQFSS